MEQEVVTNDRQQSTHSIETIKIYIYKKYYSLWSLFSHTVSVCCWSIYFHYNLACLCDGQLCTSGSSITPFSLRQSSKLFLAVQSNNGAHFSCSLKSLSTASNFCLRVHTLTSVCLPEKAGLWLAQHFRLQHKSASLPCSHQ